MKILFSRIPILMILVVFLSTISFGQTLNKPFRVSNKVTTATKLENGSTVITEQTNEFRKYYLSEKFYKPVNNFVKLDDIDTLNYPLEGTYSVYTSDGGGYVTGNNSYGDLAKANKFVIPQACVLTGILFDFYKATGGPEDIEIAVWDNNGENNSPGDIIASTTVPLSFIQNDINNEQSTFVSFVEPITITTTFYAGMILPTSAGDTLVIWSNTDGDTNPGIAWEQWSDNSWYAMFQSSTWLLNLSLAIFPIVDYGPLPLMADFMGSSTQIQPGGSVTFTDLSTGNPSSRLWTFEGGDPPTSTESNLVVVYAEEGVYDVTLTVENDTAQDTKTITDYISVVASTVEIDTLNYPLGGDYAVYVTQNNGFVTGNNEFGDLAKANYYNNNENTYITGVLYEFAYGTGSGTSIEFAIWNNSGTDNSPGSKIASKTLLLDDIIDDAAAESFTYVEFNPPVLVNGPFYAGVTLPTSTGDTLALWSNNNGDTSPGIAWELWSTNEWYAIGSTDSWGLNIAMAIYPIVQTTLDVNEYRDYNKLAVFPNPSNGNFIIDLSKLSNQNFKLKMFNTNGNCVLDQSIEKWENSISFDISDFPAGIYMIRLIDGQKTYSQKILKK